jgi:hypothetical protein
MKERTITSTTTEGLFIDKRLLKNQTEAIDIHTIIPT